MPDSQNDAPGEPRPAAAAPDGRAELQPVVIRTEDDAFELLRAALADQLEGELIQIDFDGWPTLTLRYAGPGFDSTINPAIAEALLELQAAMNRAFARAVHLSGNARSLTDLERQEIQFFAKVEPGSSAITVFLEKFGDALSTALKDKMSGKEIAATVIAVTLIAGGTVAYKDYLGAKVAEVQAEQETMAKTALTAAETERLKLVTEALATRPDLQHAAADFNEARRKALKAGASASTVTLQGVELTGAEARKIAATPRSRSEDVQLNGHYVIQKIDWQQEDEAKVTVASQDGHGVFVARFRIMALAQEQKAKLQEAEWGRRPIYMQINGTKLRGEVTTASIVAAEWQKPVPPSSVADAGR